MYVVIGGGGRIGRHIARDLATNGHEVTVIERIPARTEELVADTDVLVIEGDSTDLPSLTQAHTDRADAFVATTHDDEDNLVACQLARIAFGVNRTISRVNSPKNVEIFEALGIEAVSSTRLISELLEHEFSVGELIHLTSLKGGAVGLVEVRIPDLGEQRCPPSRSLAKLDLPHDTIVVVIFRGDETIVPHGETTIEPGDEVVALTAPERENDLVKVLMGRHR